MRIFEGLVQEELGFERLKQESQSNAFGSQIPSVAVGEELVQGKKIFFWGFISWVLGFQG